jgi:hypothetical protein
LVILYSYIQFGKPPNCDQLNRASRNRQTSTESVLESRLRVGPLGPTCLPSVVLFTQNNGCTMLRVSESVPGGHGTRVGGLDETGRNRPCGRSPGQIFSISSGGTQRDRVGARYKGLEHSNRVRWKPVPNPFPILFGVAKFVKSSLPSRSLRAPVKASRAL